MSKEKGIGFNLPLKEYLFERKQYARDRRIFEGISGIEMNWMELLWEKQWYQHRYESLLAIQAGEKGRLTGMIYKLEKALCDHQYAWLGKMPNTGTWGCVKCGKPEADTFSGHPTQKNSLDFGHINA